MIKHFGRLNSGFGRNNFGRLDRLPCPWAHIDFPVLAPPRLGRRDGWHFRLTVAQQKSIWLTSNQKVIRLTPVRRTRIFSPKPPVSLTEKLVFFLKFGLTGRWNIYLCKEFMYGWSDGGEVSVKVYWMCIFNYMFSTAFLVSVYSLIWGVIEAKRRSKRV